MAIYDVQRPTSGPTAAQATRGYWKNGKWISAQPGYALNPRNTTRMPRVTYDAAAGIAPEFAARRIAQMRGAAGGGGVGGGDVASDYQKAYDEAKAANEQRYQDILGGYRSRYGEAMDTMEGLGRQQRKDLRSDYGQQMAQQNQYLAARGLSGTSLQPTLQQGLIGKQGEAMTRLNESLKRERLGYQTGLSGDTLGFMERREDEYPDYAQMERLAKAQGQSGTGYGNVGALFGGQSAGFSGFKGAFFPGMQRGMYRDSLALTPEARKAARDAKKAAARPGSGYTALAPVRNTDNDF